MTFVAEACCDCNLCFFPVYILFGFILVYFFLCSQFLQSFPMAFWFFVFVYGYLWKICGLKGGELVGKSTGRQGRNSAGEAMEGKDANRFKAENGCN